MMHQHLLKQAVSFSTVFLTQTQALQFLLLLSCCCSGSICSCALPAWTGDKVQQRRGPPTCIQRETELPHAILNRLSLSNCPLCLSLADQAEQGQAGLTPRPKQLLWFCAHSPCLTLHFAECFPIPDSSLCVADRKKAASSLGKAGNTCKKHLPVSEGLPCLASPLKSFTWGFIVCFIQLFNSLPHALAVGNLWSISALHPTLGTEDAAVPVLPAPALNKRAQCTQRFLQTHQRHPLHELVQSVLLLLSQSSPNRTRAGTGIWAQTAADKQLSVYSSSRKAILGQNKDLYPPVCVLNSS